MTATEIRATAQRIADDLHQASDLLAGAHYTVQQLCQDLDLPAPSLLHIIAALAQTSDALEGEFLWVIATPPPSTDT